MSAPAPKTTPAPGKPTEPEPASVLETGGALRGALFEAFCLDVDEERAAAEGESIGRYRVLAELARGGMADVYLGCRDDGAFEQRVALKFPRGGSAGGEALRRFERERRILAGLEHPHIARLLDGGVDAAGRPFIALEFVDGEPIDRACDQRRLGLAARVRLLATVARAVAYAHRHLVVHRDLKPSNVLISADGQVKLLDFGIAKLLAPGEAATPTVAAPMTPAYASPEQVRGEPLSTASDVYQLGLLLYELLTGRRAQRVGGAAPAELERAICFEEPAPPSLAVRSPPGVEAAAAARGTSPAGLARALRGDLDTIALKALSKSPSRRYGSAEELAADLDRHLQGLPIAARADSRLYRAGRLAARHRLALGFTVSLAALAAAYVTTLVNGSRELRLQRDQAVAASQRAAGVQRVLVDLIHQTDPWERGGQDKQTRRLLEGVRYRVEHELAGEPAVQAELLDTLGEGRLRLGDLAAAREAFERSLALRLEQHGPAHESVADSLHDLGVVEWQAGRYAAAEPLFELALEKYRAACGEDCPRVVSMLSYLGTVHYYLGRYERAERVLRDALARRRRVMGPEHESVGVSLNNLALVVAARDRPEEAEALHREALALRRRLLGRHPDTAQSLGNLARLLSRDGEPGRQAEAERLAREALEIRRELLAADHPKLADSLEQVAALARARGAALEARSFEREAAAIRARAEPRGELPDDGHWARLAALLEAHGDARSAAVLARLGAARASSG